MEAHNQVRNHISFHPQNIKSTEFRKTSGLFNYINFMKIAILISLPLLLITQNIYAQNGLLNKATKDSIIQLLFTVDANDQKYRNQIGGVREKYGAESKELQDLFGNMKIADSLNTIIVSKIIDKYGWLGAKEIGEQCNVTLFFVIQHAELDYQDKYLPVIRDAVKNGNARAKDLALLEDRVALKHEQPQIYGSQVIWNMKENSNVVAPLADPENVDKRRASIGLGPLSEYVSAFGIEWNVEKYKKELLQITAGFFKHGVEYNK